MVVFTGGIHAREWVAPVVTYLIAEYLVKNFKVDPNTHDRFEMKIWELVTTRRLVFLPMLNPAGNLYSVFSDEKDARDWRKNRRKLASNADEWYDALYDVHADRPHPPIKDVDKKDGITKYTVPRYREPPEDITTSLPNNVLWGVDICRNFQIQKWGYAAGDSETPSDDAYFGYSAASESETKYISQVLGGFNRSRVRKMTSIDYHSYGQEIAYPTVAHDAGLCVGSYEALGKILQCLIGPMSTWFSYDYRLGTTFAAVGYDAVGTPDDYLSELYNSLAFTVELDPKTENPGFLLPEGKIQGVFEKNIRGALALIMAAGTDSGATTGKGWFGPSHAITSAERVFADWNVFGRGNNLPL